MKITLSILATAIAFLMGCQNSSASKETLFLCSCEEAPEQISTDQVTQKEKYVFLVYSEGQPDCCSARLNSAYTGYKEIWENEAPDHPNVWGRSSENLIEISATEAQELGCRLDQKAVVSAEIEKLPSAAMGYYPELAPEDLSTME